MLAVARLDDNQLGVLVGHPNLRCRTMSSDQSVMFAARPHNIPTG